MNDRELLELAAKAAGWPVTGLAPLYMCVHGSDLALIIRNDRGGESVWNPLADDGDALRLAVKLRMLVDVETDRKEVLVISVPEKHRCHSIREKCGTDPYAATRCAIVRAAAAIGEQK